MARSERLRSAGEPRFESRRWPAPYRSAVALTFQVTAEVAFESLGADVHARPSLKSYGRYGPEVGLATLLDVLAARGLRATFFVPGIVAIRYPTALKRIVAAGHEVGHHGHELECLLNLSPAAEREVLERGLHALDRVADVVPAGYRAPWWEVSPRTSALLAEYGFTYDSSYSDGDRPYMRGGVVEIPLNWSLSDWQPYAFWPGVVGAGQVLPPEQVMRQWGAEIEAVGDVAGVGVATMHPFLSGRPARAAALARLLDDLTESGVVWITALDDIASWAKRHMET